MSCRDSKMEERLDLARSSLSEKVRPQEEIDRIMNDRFPKELEDLFGIPQQWNEEAPGVYYLTMKDYGEYYALRRESGSISPEAKAYGKTLSEYPNWLVFPFCEDRSGWRIVKYELERNRVIQQKEKNGASLLDIAMFAAEFHPEYFGTYPVPRDTPCGITTRHQILDNGIYWLETNQGAQFLTVCYPIWATELDDKADRTLGLQTECDRKFGIENTYGYLFFPQAACCIPIFQLLKTRPHWISSGMVDKAALMNAIWERYPEYAMSYNAHEMTGQHDGLSELLNKLGVPAATNIDTTSLISITPDAGSDFLHLGRHAAECSPEQLK